MLRARSSIFSSARRCFSTAEASGIKVATRENSLPISELSVVIRAGSRYDTTPGVAHILEKFAYKDTAARSALRLYRESEVLGGQLSSKTTRNNIILTAKFLQEDLPYFVDAFGDVLESTQFKKHELAEDIVPLAALESHLAFKDASYAAVEAVHEAAFQTGLGNPLLSQSYNPVSIQTVKDYAREAYSKSNISIVGKGVIEKDLVDLVSDKLAGLAVGSPLASSKPTFHSSQVRVKSSGESALSIAFPVTPSPAFSIYASILGGQSAVKWSTGISPLSLIAEKTSTKINASYADYGDAGLLYVTISGATTSAISAAAVEASTVLKEGSKALSNDDITRGIAQAKFIQQVALEGDQFAGIIGQQLLTGSKAADLSTVSAQDVKKSADSLAKGKVALSAVGKVHELPFLDQLF